MIKKYVNIVELKIIISCTDKAYFNKNTYSVKYFNKEKEKWLKIPVIYPDVAFEKFINSINKEDYRELIKIVFSVEGYNELESKYDLYDQLLRENGLLDYYYNYAEDLREKTLVDWCITNNINYKKREISGIRYKYIKKKVRKIYERLVDIEFLDNRKKIYIDFCTKMSKEKKYEKILSGIDNYETFEKIIREYNLKAEWDYYFYDYLYTIKKEKSRKWGES